MNNHALLNEKYIAANLPDICAPRHELLNTFHQHANKRGIIVTAPAGFGKTVSTLLWLDASGRKSIWIGLDEYDNSPAIFYKLLCVGILSADPDNRAMAEILKSPSFSSSPVEHTIQLLLEWNTSLPPCALVFDDMHLITNSEIKKSLPYILRRLPMSFLTLILTRDERSTDWESYISEGKAAQITAEELNFSDAEIQNYFKSYGRFITPEEALAVKSTTDGWAIGVNVLVKTGQMTFGQKHNHVLDDYITKQLWNTWDPQLQEFMLCTCIVDEMTVELANLLTGREDGLETLTSLCATNSFVRRLDGDTYRYHHIFLDFLRNQFDRETSSHDKNKLYRIVSAYYLDAGELYSCVRYAVLSEDADILSAVMLELYQYSTSGSAVATHVSMQSQYLLGENMPEGFADKSPYLLISHTWYYFLMGDVERFYMYLDRLYVNLPEIIANYSLFLGHAILMTALDFRRPIIAMALLLSPELAAKFSESNEKTTTITENMPFFHRSNRDYSDFAQDIDGNLSMVEPVFSMILADDYPCISKSLRAMLHYEKNKLKDAEFDAAQAVSGLTASTVAELRFSIGITQAVVLHGLGHSARANAKLLEIEKDIAEQDAEYLLPNFKACETKLRLLDADKNAADAWLQNYFVTHPDRLELYRIVQHFTTARALMVLGQTEDAMHYLVRLAKLGADFHRPLDSAEANTLKAVLQWALGKKKEARETLETTLTTIQEYGYVRIVADEGAAVLPILRKLSAKIERNDYAGSLKPHYIREVTLAAYEQSKRHKGLVAHLNTKPVKLSKQQTHILTLLSKGYKYTEIMELTGLTIHTVKSHASAAYGKLDVNNSMDATLKARELGLIE